MATRRIKIVRRSNDRTRCLDQHAEFINAVLRQMVEDHGPREGERIFANIMKQVGEAPSPKHTNFVEGIRQDFVREHGQAEGERQFEAHMEAVKGKRRRSAACPAAAAAAAAEAATEAFDDRYARELLEDGVTVISVHELAANVARLRAELETEMMRFPEFLQTASFAELHVDNPVRYGLGGTSFIGSPSVFHTPFVRKIREEAMRTLVPRLFAPLVRLLEAEGGGKRLYFHQLVDRLMARPKKAAPQEEGWHRDVAPGSTDADHTFGGWINLDTEDQIFAAVKGSHREGRGGKLGFGTIPAAEKPRWKAAMSQQLGSRNCNEEGMIIVPPGCFMVFYENLVHTVYGKEAAATKVRQFLGWRVTEDPASTGMVHPDNRPYAREEVVALLRAQAVVPLKSGQVPPMYPGAYCSFMKAKMSVWRDFERDNLVPNSMAYPEAQRRSNTPKQNYDYTRAMRPLRDIVPADKMHPAYAKREIDLIFPGREFEVKNAETGRLERVSL